MYLKCCLSELYQNLRTRPLGLIIIAIFLAMNPKTVMTKKKNAVKANFIRNIVYPVRGWGAQAIMKR